MSQPWLTTEEAGRMGLVSDLCFTSLALSQFSLLCCLLLSPSIYHPIKYSSISSNSVSGFHSPLLLIHTYPVLAFPLSFPLVLHTTSGAAHMAYKQTSSFFTSIRPWGSFSATSLCHSSCHCNSAAHYYHSLCYCVWRLQCYQSSADLLLASNCSGCDFWSEILGGYFFLSVFCSRDWRRMRCDLTKGVLGTLFWPRSEVESLHPGLLT